MSTVNCSLVKLIMTVAHIPSVYAFVYIYIYTLGPRIKPKKAKVPEYALSCTSLRKP